MNYVNGLGYASPELRPDQLPHVNRDTSRAAAVSMLPVAASIRARILEYITAQGSNGATVDEIEIALGLSHQCASARLTEASKACDVMDLGERRPTRSGRKAIVWFSVEQAKP